MQGTVYGLVAMGFTIFFGVMNVIKFSHGDVFTFGAFGGLVAVWFAQALGLPIWSQFLFGFIAAILLASALGATISRVLILPAARRAASQHASYDHDGGNSDTRKHSFVLSQRVQSATVSRRCCQREGMSSSGAYMRLDGMLLICGGVGSIALVYLIINKTRFGLAMRAVAEDLRPPA
ncbi:ABC transporter permease subunit [Rhizobium beringeri]